GKCKAQAKDCKSIEEESSPAKACFAIAEHCYAPCCKPRLCIRDFEPTGSGTLSYVSARPSFGRSEVK
ncbi:hypothetical protein, partial [Streptomyces pseudovenezuelae]|uniref:hypothetical protein n=1 Tax=Streptomyces pseudovenezuelae TaxID=67350 RepID=UPI0034A2B107